MHSLFIILIQLLSHLEIPDVRHVCRRHYSVRATSGGGGKRDQTELYTNHRQGRKSSPILIGWSFCDWHVLTPLTLRFTWTLLGHYCVALHFMYGHGTVYCIWLFINPLLWWTVSFLLLTPSYTRKIIIQVSTRFKFTVSHWRQYISVQ